MTRPQIKAMNKVDMAGKIFRKGMILSPKILLKNIPIINGRSTIKLTLFINSQTGISRIVLARRRVNRGVKMGAKKVEAVVRETE
jgi:hypothetical protein